MSAPATLTFGTATLTACVNDRGAEIVSMRDDVEREYIWQAGPPWRRHAPILFPVVGRVPGGRIRHAGREYPHPRHGFARDRPFRVLSRSATSAALRLTSDEATRAYYPFEFMLDISYAVTGSTLTIAQTVSNTGDAVLGFALGNHPGFTLPGSDGDEVTLSFSDAEPDGYVRAPEGFLLPRRYRDVPDASGTLVVVDDLFDEDALVYDTARRRRVRLSAPGTRSVVVDAGDFPSLGIWKPVGGPFICLEPWSTPPGPLGWDGDLLDKPGNALLGPGETRTFRYTIAVE